MYNQRNWRDILAEKPKDMTRIEYEAIRTKPPKDYMTAYRINRAKRNLHRFNDKYRNGRTEVFDERHIMDKATQMRLLFLITSGNTISGKNLPKNARKKPNMPRKSVNLLCRLTCSKKSEEVVGPDYKSKFSPKPFDN